MKYCHIDINYTKDGIADCYVFTINDGEQSFEVKKRCKLNADGIATLDGAKPFECMDDVDVQLSDENWAVVDAL